MINQKQKKILFLSPEYSFLWDSIMPLFEYYVKNTAVQCVVMFYSMTEIANEGERNLIEMLYNMEKIQKLGGIICLYNSWNLNEKYEICYICSGFSHWHREGIDDRIVSASNMVVSLQTTAYYTHVYRGDKTFRDMFGEQYTKNVDYFVVSDFIADWVESQNENLKSKLLPFGYPRMDALYKALNTNNDNLNEWSQKIKGKKVFLFVGFDLNLFEYCHTYCQRDKAVLIWRPHPLSVENSVTKARIEEWGKRKNVIIDRNQSYEMAFKVSDALISWFFSSVLVNYLFTGKHVLILDKELHDIKGTDEMNFREEAWYKASYVAKNDKLAMDFVDMVIAGRDDKRQEQLLYRQFMQQGFDGNVCRRIVNFTFEKNNEVK